MMYPFMTLDDGTEIVHSDILHIDGKEKVKIYIEKPVDLGFKSVQCYLPDYEWSNNDGFDDNEIEYYKEFVQSLAHIIIELAREGGFDNASNF